MATKKAASKKKAPARKPAAPRRAVQPAAPSPAAPAPAQPDNGGGLVKVLIGGLVLVGVVVVALAIRRHQPPAAPAPAPVEAAPAPTALPTLEPIESEGPRTGAAHREDAGKGQAKAHHRHKAKAAAMEAAAAPTPATAPVEPKPSSASKPASSEGLTLSLAGGKSLTFRAWREDGDVASVDVFGPHNKVVAHVVSDAGAAGTQRLTWDGKDSQGNAVEPGRYYVRVSSKGADTLRRLDVQP